jgi:mono/diheme cytochrome c family protein
MRIPHLLALGGLLAAVMATPTQASAQDAAALYKTKCVKCHGATGAGDGSAAKTMKLTVGDLTDAKRMAEFTDARLTEIIVKGEKKMPKYDTLKPEEVSALVAYVKGLSKK